MPDDLSSIEGLADKHRRVLARQHVTDLRGLVQADRRAIHRAMANLRPRPTLELISRWQEDARSKLDEAVTDASDWHTAASFVVIFSQRQREGAWERRVEAERTEVEPERQPSGMGRLGLRPGLRLDDRPAGPVQRARAHRRARQSPGALASPAEAEPSAGAAATEASRPPSLEPGSGPQPAAARPRLRIDSATLIDAAGRTDVVKAASPPWTRAPSSPHQSAWFSPSAGPGPERACRRSPASSARTPPAGIPRPRWSHRLPARPSSTCPRSPRATTQLSLIAWAPDASAKPVSVRLPRITIRGA